MPEYETCTECGQDIDVTNNFDSDIVECPECHTRYSLSMDEESEEGHWLSDPLN